MLKYRIVWEAPQTGASGYTKAIFDEDMAKHIANQLTEQNMPLLRHKAQIGIDIDSTVVRLLRRLAKGRAG